MIRKFGYEGGTNGAAMTVTPASGDTAWTAVDSTNVQFTNSPTPLVGLMAAQAITPGTTGSTRWDLELTQQNSFEGGANGNAITGANSGGASGDAFFFTVANGSGATVLYDTARAMHGSVSAKITPVTGQTAYVQYNGSTPSSALLNTNTPGARAYFYFTALTTDQTGILFFYNTTDVRTVSVHLDSLGKLYVRDSTATILFTFSNPVPLNQWIRVEMWAKVATATTGEIHVGYYLGDSLTPVEPVYDTTTANNGTGLIGSAAFGKLSNSVYATPFWIDDVRLTDAATGFLGITNGSSTQFSFRKYVYIGGVPSVDLDLIRFSSATGGGGVNNLIIRLNSLGALRAVQNGGGFPWTTTGAQFPINQWIRLEGYGDCAAQTLRVAAYAQHDASPVVVGGVTFDSGNLTGVNVGTSMRSFMGGKLSNATGFSSICAWDADQVNTGSDVAGFIGPASTALSCVVNVTPNSGTVPFGVSSMIVATGGSGSTTTYAWNWGDGNTTAAQSGDTATHTYTVAGTYTVTGTVTRS